MISYMYATTSYFLSYISFYLGFVHIHFIHNMLEKNQDPTQYQKKKKI